MASNQSKEQGRIYLPNGRYCVVDRVNIPILSTYFWRLSESKSNSYYVKRNIVRKSKRTTEFMHRRIIGAKKGQIVDHINGNTLDNRLCNLRIVTPQQSMMNRKYVKGYHFMKKYRKWCVKIGLNRKDILIGYYNTEYEAKEARLKAENNYFGKYARTS